MESYDSEFAAAGGYGGHRQEGNQAPRPANERDRGDDIVSVTVPQWNGGSTLVVFAVPYAKMMQEFGTSELTFDQASSIALGPPLVLSVDDFTATNPDTPDDDVEAAARKVAKSYIEDLRDADVATFYKILDPDREPDIDKLRAAVAVLAGRMNGVLDPVPESEEL